MKLVTITKKPKRDQFADGSFYRKWMRFHWWWGYVGYPILGLFNSYNLVHTILHHSIFGIIFSLLGVGITVRGIWRTPKEIRNVRERWEESYHWHTHLKAMQSTQYVHMGKPTPKS